MSNDQLVSAFNRASIGIESRNPDNVVVGALLQNSAMLEDVGHIILVFKMKIGVQIRNPVVNWHSSVQTVFFF